MRQRDGQTEEQIQISERQTDADGWTNREVHRYTVGGTDKRTDGRTDGNTRKNGKAN